MNIELFEQKLSEWHLFVRDDAPWDYMDISQNEYYYWLYLLEVKQREGVPSEDTNVVEQNNIDAMSIVYFFLLLSVGVVSFWLCLMLLGLLLKMFV